MTDRSGIDVRDTFTTIPTKELAALRSAVNAARELVSALEATYWSSWQSTARFYVEYEHARESIGALDAVLEEGS